MMNMSVIHQGGMYNPYAMYNPQMQNVQSLQEIKIQSSAAKLNVSMMEIWIKSMIKTKIMTVKIRLRWWKWTMIYHGVPFNYVENNIIVDSGAQHISQYGISNETIWKPKFE